MDWSFLVTSTGVVPKSDLLYIFVPAEVGVGFGTYEGLSWCLRRTLGETFSTSSCYGHGLFFFRRLNDDTRRLLSFFMFSSSSRTDYGDVFSSPLTLLQLYLKYPSDGKHLHHFLDIILVIAQHGHVQGSIFRRKKILWVKH